MNYVLIAFCKVSALKKRLKAQQSDKTSTTLLGDGVSRAFLRAMVILIGKPTLFVCVCVGGEHFSLEHVVYLYKLVLMKDHPIDCKIHEIGVFQN